MALDKKITRIDYIDDYGNPSSFCCNGVNEIKSIEEHRAQGEGDKWFYTVVFKNGDEILIFNPDKVYKTEVKS